MSDNSNKKFTVVVEGNIGSGKTTLLDYFRKHDEVSVLPEPVEMWRNCNGSNLLGLLYEDLNEWAFSFQSYVLLTMAKQHTKSILGNIRLMERSIYSARYCFIHKMMQDGCISGFSGCVLDDTYNFLVNNEETNIDLIVYLRTSPEIVHKRMLERNRSEEKTVPLEYLRAMHEAHENWLVHKTVGVCPAPVLIVDANLSRELIDKEYERITPHVLNKIAVEYEL